MKQDIRFMSDEEFHNNDKVSLFKTGPYQIQGNKH